MQAKISSTSDFRNSNRRMDQSIAGIAVCMLLMLTGMLFDIPGLIFYPAPVLFMIFLLMGGLNLEGEIKKVLPGLVAYALIFGGMFVVMGLLRDDPSIVFGLPISSAILIYLIWPFTVLTSGALYAWVYQTWLSKSDLDRPEDPDQKYPASPAAPSPQQ